MCLAKQSLDNKLRDWLLIAKVIGYTSKTKKRKGLSIMTMPLTAGAVKESGASVPEDMTDEQIELAIWALRTDLPGAI